MTNESAVREALHELTSDQPAAPVGRFVEVRLRHVRRRQLQGMVSALTVAVAVVGTLLGAGVLTGGTSSRSRPLQQPHLSWQLPWPDRSDAAGKAVEARALAYLGAAGPGPVRDVHWLFAGKLQIGVTWAVLEATTGGAHGAQQLMALSSVDAGRTWALSSGQAPLPSTRQIGFGRLDSHWVLIITAPGVSEVGVSDLSSSSTSPAVDTAGGVAADRLEHAPSRDAVLVGSTDLASTFLVRFPDGGHGLPQWQRKLLSHAAPIAGYQKLTGVAGAVPDKTSAHFANHRGYFGPMIEVIRCVGQAPLILTVTASGGTTSQPIDRCDGRSVTLHVGTFGSDGKYSYTLTGDPDAVYAMTVYARKAK